MIQDDFLNISPINKKSSNTLLTCNAQNGRTATKPEMVGQNDNRNEMDQTLKPKFHFWHLFFMMKLADIQRTLITAPPASLSSAVPIDSHHSFPQ